MVEDQKRIDDEFMQNRITRDELDQVLLPFLLVTDLTHIVWEYNDYDPFVAKTFVSDVERTLNQFRKKGCISVECLESFETGLHKLVDSWEGFNNKKRKRNSLP